MTTHIEVLINRFKIVVVLVLFFVCSNLHGQTMMVWTHGKCTKVDTTEYVLPKNPNSPDVRYVEFSDFVVEVSSVNVYDSIVDTIRYREGEYPGNLIPVPAKIAKIDIEKIYYRFYLEDSPDMIWHETPSHFVFLPDSVVKPIKYILWPAEVQIPDEPCLIWVDVEYSDCLVFREIVTEDMVFVNQYSDYCGSLKRNINRYEKLPSLIDTILFR